MLPSIHQSRRWVVLIALAFATIGLSGCVPTTWLPDSSGFIYVKPAKGKNFGDLNSGQLVHFDLRKKTSRVIVEDIGMGTTWPALSPDGKRIAVARLRGERKEAKTLQVVLYDFDGKELHKSKEFPWTAARDNVSFGGSSAMLFWSPTDDMVVISDLSETGIYNVKADSLKVFEKTALVIHGGTPIRPDGKGFLLTAGDNENKRLAFMDWTGTEQKIDVNAFVPLMDNGPKGAEVDPVSAALISALILPSWWDGNSAVVGFKRKKTTYAIDTVKKKIEVSDGFAALAKAKQREQNIFFDFAGDVSVRLEQFAEEQPGVKFKKTFNKVVIMNNRTAKEQVLEARAPEQGMFLASPDGKHVALCMSPALGDGDSLILVISNNGELVSKMTFAP